MRKTRAFTLLELLVATALSTVLMIGVLAVVADLGAPEVAAGIGDERGAAGEAEAADAWVGLLREDLAHAHSIDASKANEVVLMGYGALDGRGRERTHRPVLVLYKIEMIDGRPWLVRRQAVLDVLTNQNVQRDLVCCGVTRFELVGLGGIAGTGEIRTLNAGTIGAGAGTASQGGVEADQAEAESEAGPEVAAGPGGQGPSAGRTSAPPRESGIEGVEFPADGPEGQVRIRGNWIFIELVPWVLEGRSGHEGTLEEADPAAGRTELPAGAARRRTGPSEAGPAGGDEGGWQGGIGGSDGGQQAADRRPVGTVWRLRLWTDDAARPTCERIVMIETGGRT